MTHILHNYPLPKGFCHILPEDKKPFFLFWSEIGYYKVQDVRTGQKKGRDTWASKKVPLEVISTSGSVGPAD